MSNNNTTCICRINHSGRSCFWGHCEKECCHPEIKELNRQIKMLKAKQDAIYELCVHTNDPDKDLTLSDMIINKILE